MSENRPKPYLGNPQETIAVLNRYKFAFQKKFGQNFLIDTHVLERMRLVLHRMILCLKSDRVSVP